ELDGARAAGRDAGDGDTLDAERVEQGRREVGLLLGRASVLDRGAEIAGPVRRQHPVAGADEVIEEAPAVVSDVAAVDVQDDWAVAPHAVLDRAAGGLNDLAVGGCEPPVRREPAAIP